MSTKRRLQLLGVLFLFLWTLFTLYPQPTKLAISIYRLIVPPVNPDAPEILYLIENVVKENSSFIEKFVIAAIPYQYDWQTHNVPWYFPTVKEVFEKGAGDCKARAIVIASILEAHNKEYSINASASHIWVDYEGKSNSTSERKEIIIFSHGEKLEFQLPRVYWENHYKMLKIGFWDYMPENKKTMLILGSQFFLIINYIALFYDIIRVKFCPYFF